MYLGACIPADGKPHSEISRRLGYASAEFRQLRQVWNHANVPMDKKVGFFQSFVLSKLSYGLCTLWLTKAQQKRIDGFQARCLRQIVRVPAAYVSRVSNEAVRTRAKVEPVSAQIARAQAMLLGRVGRSPIGSALRRDTLLAGTATPLIGLHIRRVGRPRQDWATHVMAQARQRFASTDEFERSLLDCSHGSAERWRCVFSGRYFSAPHAVRALRLIRNLFFRSRALCAVWRRGYCLSVCLSWFQISRFQFYRYPRILNVPLVCTIPHNENDYFPDDTNDVLSQMHDANGSRLARSNCTSPLMAGASPWNKTNMHSNFCFD